MPTDYPTLNRSRTTVEDGLPNELLSLTRTTVEDEMLKELLSFTRTTVEDTPTKLLSLTRDTVEDQIPIKDRTPEVENPQTPGSNNGISDDVPTSCDKWLTAFNNEATDPLLRYTNEQILITDKLCAAAGEECLACRCSNTDNASGSEEDSDSAEGDTLQDLVEETEHVDFDPRHPACRQPDRAHVYTAGSYARGKEPHKVRRRFGKTLRELEEGWVGIGNVRDCHPLSPPRWPKRCYYPVNRKVCGKIGRPAPVLSYR